MSEENSMVTGLQYEESFTDNERPDERDPLSLEMIDAEVQMFDMNSIPLIDAIQGHINYIRETNEVSVYDTINILNRCLIELVKAEQDKKTIAHISTEIDVLVERLTNSKMGGHQA